MLLVSSGLSVGPSGVGGQSTVGCVRSVTQVRTLIGDDGVLSFVVESFGFKKIFLVDIAPVMAPCTTLAETLVHASLGLGSVLDYGTGRERTFGAGHDGRSGGERWWGDGPIGWGLYRRDHLLKALVTSNIVDHDSQPDHPAKEKNKIKISIGPKACPLDSFQNLLTALSFIPVPREIIMRGKGC